MDRLTAAIPPRTIVGIDSVVFIYHLEGKQPYRDIVKPFFDAHSVGQFTGITSVITLMEIAVLPLRLGQVASADRYEALLCSFPNLRVVDVDLIAARRAAEIRARDRLRPPDSIQVAAALVAGATVFLTNDRAFARVADLRVLMVDDFLPVP